MQPILQSFLCLRDIFVVLKGNICNTILQVRGDTKYIGMGKKIDHIIIYAGVKIRNNTKDIWQLACFKITLCHSKYRANTIGALIAPFTHSHANQTYESNAGAGEASCGPHRTVGVSSQAAHTSRYTSTSAS